MKFLSVCSGIEAASTAWRDLGMTPVAFAEIEKFPIEVLRHHHPRVPNLGDLTKYRDWPLDLLAQVDLLVGGTPCQSFSQAGLRGGLEDERGNLTLIFIHLLERIDHARSLFGRPPALCLWENVPGVLNHNDNPYGHFLAGLAGADVPLQPPGDGWTDCGAVFGPKRTIAWRVLDAQYFGLAQRRERVFAFASPRNGPDPTKVLFEWEGMRRDSAPGREPGQSPAGAAPEGTGGRGIAEPITRRPYSDRGPDANILPERAPTLDCRAGRSGANTFATSGGLIPEVAGCITKGEGQRNDWETCTIIPFPANLSGTQAVAEEGLPSLGAKNPSAIAFSGRARGDDGRGYDRAPQVFGDITGALETVKTHCVATMPAVAYVEDVSPTVMAGPTSPASHGKQSGSDRGALVAYTLHGADGTKSTATPAEVACALTTSPPGEISNSSTTVAMDYAVRRLTPTECERLQGFPDGHTRIAWRGAEPDACPDSPRYRALGNSMAVAVMRWLGRRIKIAWLITWPDQASSSRRQ